jgi:SAM-dependent methyltransferase
MEHFNFNPVKFVREFRRVLKPGGKAYINVPNNASFQNLVSLIFGRF